MSGSNLLILAAAERVEGIVRRAEERAHECRYVSRGAIRWTCVLSAGHDGMHRSLGGQDFGPPDLWPENQKAGAHS